MNLLKKKFALLLAVTLCLSLTACGNSDETEAKTEAKTETKNGVKTEDEGTDWRASGSWDCDGTIIQYGEYIDVLVCVNKADATFYYNMQNKMMFGSVEYPITLEGDAGEMFQYIDFADLNGDDNSDVLMKFEDSDDVLLMVWYWDTDTERFAYQPEESQLGYNIDGWGNVISDDDNTNSKYSWNSELCQRYVSDFEGVWYYEGDLSAMSYIIIDGDGNWSYFERASGEAEGTEMDYGTFTYSTTEVSTYYADSLLHGGLSIRVFEFDEGALIWNEDIYYRME